MGMDLTSAAGDFHFSRHEWVCLLDLAELYNWTPIGTAPPEYPPEIRAQTDWTGGYYSNDYQRVLLEDATALAAALEQALDDIPDMEPIHKLVTFEVPSGSQYVGINPAAPPITPLEAFAGIGGKHQLREFIAFCRAGAFMIG